MKKMMIPFLFILVSCSVNPKVAATLSNTEFPSILSPTTEKLPSAQTLTVTSTPRLILTPVPTIPAEVGLETLYTQLEGNDKCLLPCWAGIIPGQTKWNDANQLLQAMSSFSTIDVYLDAGCNFGDCNLVAWSLPDSNDGLGYVYSLLPDDYVHIIQIEVTDSDILIDALGLKNILSKYGEPSIVVVKALPEGLGEDIQGELAFGIILVYPDKQFAIRYLQHASLTGNMLVSCNSDFYIELIILDNKETLASIDVIAKSAETKDLGSNMKRYKSVEEAMGMTTKTFYETFSKENAPCMTTQKSIWRQ